jgi:outer membrane protein assembly factor BamB
MARDSRSGELLWQQDGPIDDTYGGYFDGTLKYGRVFLNYTGYNTDSFKATNLRTGDVIWEQPLWENDSAFSYAPLVFQDSMFSFPMNRFLAAYDVASGAEKWMSRIAAGNYKTSALSFDPADGKLRLVNLLYDSQPFTFLKTGFLDWDFGRENMQQYFRTTPVFAGNVALFQTDYDLLAVDLTTHQELWNVEGYNGYDSGNHPAVDGHEVYAIVDDDLKVFDLSDGSLLWEYIVPEAFQYSPVLTQHYVYVQSLTKIYILDRRTHEMVQTLDGDGRFVVADGHLYHLLSSASGAIIRIYRAENP